MITENFKHVLDNYYTAYTETFRGHPLADFIRQELGTPFEEQVDINKYKISPATGQGRWTTIPSLSTLNKEITTSPEKGYYIVYLFKANMEGVYLSLNFGSTEFKKRYGKNNLPIAAENFRKLLEDFIDVENNTPLDLGKREDTDKTASSKDYEAGNIYSVYYPKDSLPSDDKLIEDYNLFLQMYDHIYEERGNTIFTKEELEHYNITPITRREEEEKELSSMKFNEYLKDKKFFFDKKTIENYLLSLKVKPFIILTGNSGTGKTKLSQLFAKYLNTQNYPFEDISPEEDPNYHYINVTTKLMSWGKKKNGDNTTPGWGLSNEDFKNILPINKIEGEYEIEIGGHKTTANIYFLSRLFYKRDAEEFKSYFEELYNKEQEQIRQDNENGITHTDQKVKLGISYDAFKNAMNTDCEQSDVITVNMNISDTVLKGNRIDLPKEFRPYSPFKSSVPCNIICEGHSTEANLELILRIGHYTSDEIMDYLNSLKENNIDSFELKIYGFKPNIEDFIPIPYSSESDGENNIAIKDNHAIVPVGSNWTENRNVVGYYNVLTKSYQHTQSLDLLLTAEKQLKRPYFLILDEMNLSHVERYFSDFLSAMESNEPIPLHKATDNNVDVPKELKLPENVFIIGTVNVDETTYMFSPKVLDRANVLEFKTFEELSISNYVRDNIPSVIFSGDVDYLENVLSDPNLRENILEIINDKFNDVKFKVETVKIENKGEENEEEITETIEGNVLDEIIKTLSKINEYLKGSGFEFGYRTVNEILAFMYVAWKYENQNEEWNNWMRYLDAQILQKILPKLHGSKMVLGDTLDNLLAYCLGIESIDNISNLTNIDLTEFDAPYPDSAKKLIQMKDVLEKLSYVSFIN